MTKQSGRLQGLKTFLVLLLAALLATGCANSVEQDHERVVTFGDTRLKTVLQQSLAVSGGIETWSRLEQINGQAIATVYEKEGCKVLIEQQCQFIPDKKIVVSLMSYEPAGILTEVLDRKGNPIISLQDLAITQYETDPEKLYGAAIKLRVLAQAMMGPAGLLRENLDLRYAGQERKSGRLMHKIEVMGEFLPLVSDDKYASGNLLVVWIDDQTHQIRHIWLRYRKRDKAFGYLALDIGDYEKVSDRLLLPQYIAYAHSDRYQQLNQQQIMTIEFQKLQTKVRDKDRKWLFEF